MSEAQKVWSANGKQIAVVDPAKLIDGSFAQKSNSLGTLGSASAPVNPTFVLTSAIVLPQLTPEQVGNTTPVAELPLKQIAFEPDSANLTEKGRNDLLTQVVPVLKQTPGLYLKVEGGAAQPLGAGVVTLLEAGPAARIGVACGKKFLETLALAQGIEILEQPDQCRCTHLHGAVAARVVQAYQNREFAPGVRYAQACAQRAHCRRAELFVPDVRRPAIARRERLANIVHQHCEARGCGQPAACSDPQREQHVLAGIDFWMWLGWLRDAEQRVDLGEHCGKRIAGAQCAHELLR